jgi:hypothetical protein
MSAGIERVDLTFVAVPAVRAALPLGHRQRFFPVGQLVGERPVAVQHEAGAVEHDLVLPADAVEEDERQAGFGDTLCRDLAGAEVVLVDLIRAAVRRDEKLGALRPQVRADRREPDVLADRQGELDAAPFDDARQRAGGEPALLVEGAIVGQFVLAGGGDDPTPIDQVKDVVEPPFFGEHRTDDHRRAAIGAGLDETVDLFGRAPVERRLQHQILGRVADQLEFGEDDQVCGAGLRAPLQHRVGVGREIADALADLDKSDAEPVGHRGAIRRV